jgi:hypothetical protein
MLIIVEQGLGVLFLASSSFLNQNILHHARGITKIDGVILAWENHLQASSIQNKITNY